MNMHQAIRAETPRRHHFTQADYLLLQRSGAFRHHARTELIEGEIIAVNAQYSLHGRVQKRLFLALSQACDGLGGGVEAWVEVSVDLKPDSLPTPDMMVTRELPENAPAPAASVLLIVEVAESTLTNDLNVKAPLYARHGIPEYWVADVNSRVIHQMWSPESGIYSERRAIPFGGMVTSNSVTDLTILTDRL